MALLFKMAVLLAVIHGTYGQVNSCFFCDDGSCISNYSACDGFYDCDYGEDEIDCDAKTCDPDSFVCYDGTCIPASWFCDGYFDCFYEEDEEECNEIEDEILIQTYYNFSSINYPSFYPNNARMQLVFSTLEDSRLLLSFDFIKIEHGWDYIFVGDGTVPEEQPLLTWSGGPSYNELKVLSTGNSLWFIFEADEIIYDQGFSALVEVVNLTQSDLNCGNEFNCTNGVCLPNSDVCDGVENCKNDEDESIQTCYSDSPCGEPLIEDGLVSHNPEISSYPKGTKLAYACPNGYDLKGNMTSVCLYGMWTNEAVFCTATPCEDLAPAGELVKRDPIDEGPFENGTEVVYSCPDGYDFNGDMTAICLYGNWTLDQEPYCTVKTCDPGSFVCNNGTCITDNSVCDGYYDCYYGEDEIDCDEEIFITTSYNFTSLNYPFDYPNNHRTELMFTTFENSRLLMSFDFIEIERTWDFIYVGNGNELLEQLLLTWSGGPSYNELKVLSTENSMWLIFDSDGSITSPGFYGSIEVVPDSQTDLNCGNEFNCMNGVCLPNSDVCDRVENCENDEDESIQTCYSVNTCDPGSFVCNNGTCITDNSVCDGYYDCIYGEDEIDCDGNNVYMIISSCNITICNM
ncbi:scavenger receptor cysteine-rich domain-containing protein DMBT1-like [Apostichopus japonicus]|uniref:scavenger receptor cysteine-rich domain-containing protein DMBT1-like n=1 Tax=Stichopus japonicus TaxID=307972 RepID=UPI003AB8A4D5